MEAEPKPSSSEASVCRRKEFRSLLFGADIGRSVLNDIHESFSLQTRFRYSFMNPIDANSTSSVNALHPAQRVSNIKRHVPLTLDLKKVQYDTWAELFQVVARAHLVMDHLDGSLRDLDVPAEKWIQIDSIVLSWIYSTISEDLLLTVIKPGFTARHAWLCVKNVSLENQFNHCELANFSDVNSYCQHLKSLADQLSDVGNAVSDQRLVLQLIKGLTPAYDSLGRTISNQEPLPSFIANHGILLRYETLCNHDTKSATIIGPTTPTSATVSPLCTTATVSNNNKTSTNKKRKRTPRCYRGSFARSIPRNETVSSPSSNSQVHDGLAGNTSFTAKSFSEMIDQQNRMSCSSFLGIRGSASTKKSMDALCRPDGELPEKLRTLEPYLIERISNEIMNNDPNVRWEDIAGLHHAKKCATEMVIWPLLRPDIFKGCRSPGRGLLLFGPPGTGKTMIGKAIAGEAKATFFYISASSLAGKWYGEGEKLVRALFGVASCRQPAVIFVDEIDSLLSQRKSDGEHEASRRLKTQFLVEMEGFDSGSEQILLIGATNRPQELDEAARRRLTKRFYIPLPSSEARAWIIRNLLEKDGLFKLSTDDIDNICKLTEGYSGSDMKNLVKDASMGPLREALRQGTEITKLKKEDMRAVTLQDFEKSLQEVRPSVSLNELGAYEDWNNQFGSLSPSSMQP